MTDPLLDSLRDLFVPPVWGFMALAIGLVVGSFANVCIHRLPRGVSIVTPRSSCPRCGALIHPLDNVPVLSWMLLRGRCRGCQAPISIRYPAVEAVNGTLYAALAVSHPPNMQTFVAMGLVTALLVLGFIDLEHQILPNAITIPGVALGIAASLLPGSPVTWRESVSAALGGYLALWAFASLARLYYREEALGQGDWKLVAMIGAFLGWRQTLLSVFLGAVLGSIVGVGIVAFGRGTGRTKVPFGTFIAAGAVVCLFAGQPIVNWYRELLHG
jgi:leader peptidase (prepilin peptidase)/N-methyltransferase